MTYTNLIELLVHRKTVDGTKGITFINGTSQEEFLSYKDLYDRSIQLLAVLQVNGLKTNDELIIQITDTRSFLIVFWACILGGMIPVPLSIGQKDEHKRKLFNVWNTLNNPYLITDHAQLATVDSFAQKQNLSELFSKIKKHTLLLDTLFESHSFEGKIANILPDDIAFIQFSSGSTGSPKGVVLSHKNLLANVHAIATAACYTSSDSMLSWMPLTHDMGMIGFHINPLFSGMNQFIMPTDLFIRRPGIWLEKASTHKVTILCSPNFGYSYVLKHTNEKQTTPIDLSSVRIIYNGAEPISLNLAQDFTRQMEKHGLRQQAMCPVYGLAEASLAATISDLNAPIVWLAVDRQFLRTGDRVQLATDVNTSVSFVNVGKQIPDCFIKVMDENQKVVAEMIIGHIYIKGLNVTKGYYNNNEETLKTRTADDWVNTGDLGFIQHDCLYVTGRAKEILFINGQNYYPHDIEAVACELQEIELNKIVVCGTTNPMTEKEEVILFLFHRGSLDTFLPLVKRVQDKIGNAFGIQADHVIPVKEIPRTTSGKLQRLKLLDEYKKGVFQQLEDQLLTRLNAAVTIDDQLVFIPASEIEFGIVELWKSVLNRSVFSINDTFFNLGGNSLRAAELAMQIYKRFGLEVSLSEIYQNPTIPQQALLLSGLKSESFQPISIQVKQTEYTLSLRQKSLYYMWSLNPSSLSYNIPVACRIPVDMNPNSIEEVLQKMIAQHDVLRMSFRDKEEPTFSISDPSFFKLQILHVNQTEISTVLQQLVQPFDLLQPGLFRITFIHVDSGEKYLFLDFHHIISDGTSVNLFIRELFERCEGKSPTKSTLEYKDFAKWEAQQLTTQKLVQQAAWWMNVLTNVPAPLQLPTEYNRPLLFDYKGRKQVHQFDVGLIEQLKAFVALRQCTLHTFLFSVYKLLVYQYSGQHDMLIGIPVSGRRHPDLQDLQGMFVNVLCIRNAINTDQTFNDYLRSEQNNLIHSLDHQDFPFELLIENLNLKRDPGRNPLFDTMFVYQQVDLKQTIGNIQLEQFLIDASIAKYDLTLEIVEGSDSISYQFEYATSLFSNHQIEQFANHFEQLIHSVLNNSDQVLGKISSLSETEWETYLVQYNSTNKTYPSDPTILHLIEKQAQLTPNNIAIKEGESTVTYADLVQDMTTVANQISALGVHKDDTVGLLMERSIDFVIALLGILKAGGTYVPIESELPITRINYILNHSEARFLFVDKKNKDRIPELTVIPALVVLSIEELRGNVAQNFSRSFPPADLAYIIYTSGTTGVPKGVMIPQKALVNYICGAAEHYCSNEKTDFAFHTSISFDLTITSLFTPLITGGAIVVYRDEPNEVLINKIIRDNRVDTIKLTPAHLNLLLQSGITITASNCLKRFIVGGEKLESELVNQINVLFEGNVAIYNEYGPTETTVGCMIYKCSNDEVESSIPIGQPFSNTQIYILDNDLNPKPTGAIGELYVSGEGLAKGYLKDDELTKHRFIMNPFIDGRLMYRTGDLAYFNYDNEIVYIGRIDEQLKINGYRIEPQEIRSHLLNYPGVQDVVVLPVLNKQKKTVIAAYFVPEDACKHIDQDQVIDYLAERIPFYMIPAYLVQIDTIPLTVNGKIDTTALSSINGQRVNPHLVVSVTENIMKDVWEEVLVEKDVEIQDNFFDLGGDSIKAVQIVSRLTEHKVFLKVKDIMIYQTIQRICQHIGNGIENNYDQGYVSGSFNPFPIHSWLLSREFSNIHFYNQSVLLELREQLNLEYLSNVLTTLVNHHDALRLNYDKSKEQFFYNPAYINAPFSIEEYHVEDYGDEQLVFQQLKNKFNLYKRLLINAAIIHENGKQRYLMICAHHVLVDGLSWRILLEDLTRLYTNGPKTMLAAKTASLIQWGEALEMIAGEMNHSAEMLYWNKLEQSKINIPIDNRSIDWCAKHSVKRVVILDKASTEVLLKQVHKRYATDIQSVLLAALALTLNGWVENTSCVIELENHGRNVESIDAGRTIGWFTVMHPFELFINTTNLEEAIISVREGIKQIPGNGLGYGLLKSYDEMAEIRFNYLGVFGEELSNKLFSYSLNDKGLNADEDNGMTAKLEWNLMVSEGQLNVELIYNSMAHTTETIDFLMGKYVVTLGQITELLLNTEDQFTVSNFGLSEMDQQEFDGLFV